MLDIFKKVYIKLRKWTEGDLGIPVRNDVPTERIGTPYGGWIIPRGQLDQNAVCYLVGAGEDISFDLGLAHLYGCPVHTFDPTPRAIAHVNQLIENLKSGVRTKCVTSPDGYYPEYPPALAAQLHFHPYGVWNKDEVLKFYAPENEAHVSHSLVNLQKSDAAIEVPVRALSAIVHELGHDHIDLLKLDVEGAEYQILEEVIEGRVQVRILCIEFDETAANHLDRHYLKRISRCLEDLQKIGFEVVGKEPDCRNYTLLFTPGNS
ncbi:MAG: FkbM family methyltransferase [Bacteroidetes bacterium]|nr:MAG: FkbM family methyltransferase [Bacteroidota bacterium]